MCVCVFVSGAQKLLMMVAYLKPEIIELVDKCSMVRRTHTRTITEVYCIICERAQSNFAMRVDSIHTRTFHAAALTRNNCPFYC